MEKNFTARPDITTSQNLTVAALSYTTTIGRKFILKEISFKASGVITETITITKDSVNGVSYDSVLRSISLVGQTSYVYRPGEDEDFQAGDEVLVACTNAGGVESIFVTIKTRELE